MHEPDRSPVGGQTAAQRLFLYTRRGCHLCDDTRSILAALFEERAARGLAVPGIEERNIDTDEAWHRAFLETIPVVEIGDRRLALALSPSALRRFLADALDGAPATPSGG